MIDSNCRNYFLDRVMARLRAVRPMVPTTLNYALRIERIANAPFVTLWFRTRGCRHDYMGGCTMCNYGRSTPVKPDEMIESVRQGLAQAPKNQRMMLLVSPSGSMLDDWEVPIEAQEGIFELVRNTDCSSYICETRIETITDAKIRRYKELLADKPAYIEVGLETSDPWISKYCVNKAISKEKFIQGMSILRQYDVPSIANVIVGTPFLTEKETIEDAYKTIKWALENGTSRCTLFPVHVKRWTLVEWLWKNDLYTPVSLWSLVEVLKMLGPSLSSKVTISWYKIYIEKMGQGRLDSATDLGYLASPTTCPKCQTKVIAHLDAFRDTSDFTWIENLVDMQCKCKETWRLAVNTHPTLTLPERVASVYEVIGKDILGNRWWENNRTDVVESLNSHDGCV